MKLACNYYPEAEQLLDENIITPHYFKFPAVGFQMDILKDLAAFEAFCQRVTAKRPILLHGLAPIPHDLSVPSLRKSFQADTAQRLIDWTHTPGLSFHPTLSAIPDDAAFRRAFAAAVENAGFLKEKYAHMDFVSLENLDTARWGDFLRPEVMTRLIAETGCDFLLDISHAFCAARHLELPVMDYIKALPLEKTVEIHINGWAVNEKGVMCHLKIHEEGYALLAEVLQHCAPKIVTVEYGRHDDRIGVGCPLMSADKINEEAKKEIAEQLHRIREILY